MPTRRKRVWITRNTWDFADGRIYENGWSVQPKLLDDGYYHGSYGTHLFQACNGMFGLEAGQCSEYELVPVEKGKGRKR